MWRFCVLIRATKIGQEPEGIAFAITGVYGGRKYYSRPSERWGILFKFLYSAEVNYMMVAGN